MDRFRFAALGIIALVAGGNIAYLLVDCPLDLAPDEAHYWDWSRRLDLSYYSKGPLVAWLIRGSCELFGTVSIHLTGSLMPAVRLPAILAHAALLLGMFQLAAAAFHTRFAFWSVLLLLSVPTITAPSVLMTIDMPYLACWAWACVCVLHTVRRAMSDQPNQSSREVHSGCTLLLWSLAGVFTAFGVLAKYTMLVFPASVAIFLFVDPARRRELLRPGFLLFALIGLLGLMPIVWWNAMHDWIGIRHVLAQADGTTGLVDTRSLPVIDLRQTAEFLLGQFAALLGYWFIAWCGGILRYRPDRVADPRIQFLWWMAVPMWCLFALVSLQTAGQINWPAASYVTGFLLATAWVLHQIHHPNQAWRTACRFTLACFLTLGVLLTLFARYPEPLRPVVAQFLPAPTNSQPTPIRRFDPTCRVRGWQELARVVDELREQVRHEEGRDPYIAGMVWTLPGELAFYCENQPETFTFGPALADRHSQYDLWRPNPLADAQVFRGRTFLYVGEEIPNAKLFFDRIDAPVEVTASDGGVPMSRWTVWILRGFRGFPAASSGRTGTGF